MTRGALILLLVVLIISAAGCETQKGKTPQAEEAVEIHQPQEPAMPDQAKESMDVVEIEEKRPAEQGNADYTALLTGKYSICIECHGDVKGFHAIAVIYLIDEEKGIKPRLCIACHGQKVHDIHWALLDEKRIVCDTCHSYRGEFTQPKPKEGQLLVCEACHSGGNYVKIHIEGSILEGAPIDEKWITRRAGHQCNTCHVGDFDTIHFDPLSIWKEKIDRIIEESESQPLTALNISYL